MNTAPFKSWEQCEHGDPPRSVRLRNYCWQCLAELQRDALEKVKLAADAIVAHIGCYGEIDSRHTLTLDLLEALNATDQPPSQSDCRGSEK